MVSAWQDGESECQIVELGRYRECRGVRDEGVHAWLFEGGTRGDEPGWRVPGVRDEGVQF
jgi:hypothetical protein